MKRILVAIVALVALASCAPKQTDAPLRLNCPMTVSPENRAAAIELCKELVDFSRKDEGNISYDVFVSATDSCQLLIFETWKDQASLDKHSAAEHFTRLVPQIQALGTMEVQSFKMEQ